MRDGWAGQRWLRSWMQAGLLLSAVALSGSAAADEPPPTTHAATPVAAAAPEEAHWSLAAGVSPFSYGAVIGGALVPGVLTTASSLPANPNVPVGVTLERRLLPAFWVLARVAYASSSSSSVGTLGTSPAALLARTQSSRWQGGLSLGVRAVFNPGALVEVGATAELGLARSVSKSISDFEPNDSGVQVPTQTVTTGGKTVSGVMGVTAEHFFTPGLSLRLSLQVVRIAKSWTSAGTLVLGAEPPPNANGESFDAGFTFAPAFDLRFQF